MEDKLSYERRGLEALYAFTPFKIVYKHRDESRGKTDAYVLVILPPKRYYTLYVEDFKEVENLNIENIIRSFKKENYDLWKKLWQNRFKRRHPIQIENIKIYEYESWPSLHFKESKSPYVLIIDEVLYNVFNGSIPIEDERVKRIFNSRYKYRRFLLAEYNFNSLSNPFFCSRGYVLITHRQKCPVKNICPYGREGRCNGSLLRIGETYTGLYKVFPQVKVKILSPMEIASKMQLHIWLFSIRYNWYPLLNVYFANRVSLLAFYEGIVFQPKKSFLQHYLIKFGRTPGVRIIDTDALILEFDVETLDKVVNELLQKDYSWPKFKKSLLSKSDLCSEKSCEKSPKILRPWRFLEEELRSGFDNEKNLNRVFNDLIGSATSSLNEQDKQYYRFIIVHTIAHNVLLSLWRELGLSEAHLRYKIDSENGRWAIYIYEAVSGGLGYLRLLAFNRKSKLYEIIEKSIYESPPEEFAERYCSCTIRDEDIDTIQNMLSDLRRKCGENDDDCIKAVNKLQKFVNSIYSIMYKKFNVTLHPYTITYILNRIVPGRLSELFSNVVESILSLFLPFDGSIYCGFIEEGCSLGPFLEPLSISYTVMKHIADNGKQYTPYPHADKIVVPWMKLAKNKLKIMTSNISLNENHKVYKTIKSLCERSGKVYILLGKNAVDDEASKKTAEMFLKNLGKCVEIRLHPQLHAKAVIIDDVAVVEGSFNLTISGLSKNIEFANILLKPDEVKRRVEDFDKLWNESKEYFKNL
ncbi:phospholipase D-like domain-containing protein [Ignisphaera sp. 4213-co]|uniref:Phospholipase D-like domain-containing protein n=1 Tax=Ignisphaera cupida TaxID=3050454 RepID=A0ABD4Z6L7_9CREN|nr:phospholipase D-like domain-containing protein [Ignisphaera sp. 4213-co]MDK6028874.1 phospholipase D-like domain-containing protein [Ignisphaera sp. 4213-co]